MATASVPYECFAFISYSRADIRLAKQLQSDLEWYRIPVDVARPQGLPPGASHIRPVVRDKTDLDVRPVSFWVDVERYLTNTRYLIVLCSPTSAGSVSVDREIRHFLACRPDAAGSVVPVIVSGAPNSRDASAECLPPALRELGDILTGRNMPTYVASTREEVLLQTVAFLLGVRYSVINDRYQKHKQRRLRRLLVVALLVTFVFAAIAAYALVQRREAQHQARLAGQMAIKASASADESKRSEVKAMRRLGESLVLTGDVLAMQDDSVKARAHYSEAVSAFRSASASPYRAEVALSVNYQESPLPLLDIGSGGPVRLGMAVSPDSRSVVSYDADGRLRVWDVRTGRETRSFAVGQDITAAGKLPLSMVHATVAVLPSGDVAAVHAGDDLALWDITRGTLLKAIKGSERWSDVRISDDGRRAVCIGDGDAIEVFRLPEGDKVRSIRTGLEGLVALGISGDGGIACVSSLDEDTKCFDLESGATVSSLKRQTPLGCALNKDGSLALTTDIQGGLYCWNVRNPRIAGKLWDSPSRTSFVSFDASGRYGIVPTGEQQLSLVEIRTRALTRGFDGNLAVFSPDGSFLVTRLGSVLKLWDLGSVGREMLQLAGHTDSVEAAALSTDGRMALSASSDGTARIWDVPTGHTLRRLDIGKSSTIAAFLHPREPWAVLVRTDGQGQQGSAVILDLSTGLTRRTVPLGPLYGGADSPTAALSPDGGKLLYATASQPPAFEACDLETGKRLFHTNVKGPGPLTLTADGKWAIAGRQSGGLYVFDARTGLGLREIDGPEGAAVIVLTATSDSAVVAAGLLPSRSLALWDLNSGKDRGQIETGDKLVSGLVATGAADSPLITVSDAGVRFWDPVTASEVASLINSPKEVDRIASACEGRILLLYGLGHQLAVYDISRAAAGADLAKEVEAAQRTLATTPSDPAACVVLGRWYAYLRRDDWAIDFLLKARAGGQAVDPITLARCYWGCAQRPALAGTRSPAECRSGAVREFNAALEAAQSEPDRNYLRFCRDAALEDNGKR